MSISDYLLFIVSVALFMYVGLEFDKAKEQRWNFAKRLIRVRKKWQK